MQWYIYVQHFYEYHSTSQPTPFAPFACPLPIPLCNDPPLFYLLGNPSFGDCGANAHPHSSLVGDWLPTPCSLPSHSLPNGSHRSCNMFSKTTSQHQLHCLIHVCCWLLLIFVWPHSFNLIHYLCYIVICLSAPVLFKCLWSLNTVAFSISLYPLYLIIDVCHPHY